MSNHNQRTLERLEQEIATAHLTLDLDVFDTLLHPDYVIVQPGGRVETKQDVLASYRSGKRHWSFAHVDQLDTRVYGDSALVIGRWLARGSNNGVDFDYAARFLSMWIKTDGLWQNVSNQSAEIT